MIHIGINPNIVIFGRFTIYWHAILMVIAIAVGVLITLRLAKKAGFSQEAILTVCFWAVIFGIIGARVSWALDPENLSAWKHPTELLAIQNGGLGWYGALIGGILAVVVYSQIKKFPLARFADAAAPAIILGLAIGRIG